MILWVECTECSPCLEMLVVLLNCNSLTVTSHHVKHWQQQALVCLSSTTSALICSVMELKMYFFDENCSLISSSHDDSSNFLCLLKNLFQAIILRGHRYATIKHKYESLGQFHTIRTTSSAESREVTQQRIFQLRHTPADRVPLTPRGGWET